VLRACFAQRPPDADFPAFQRATHSGTAVDHDGNTFAYSAVRLP
jgi:hypothetical protein